MAAWCTNVQIDSPKYFWKEGSGYAVGMKVMYQCTAQPYRDLMHLSLSASRAPGFSTERQLNNMQDTQEKASAGEVCGQRHSTGTVRDTGLRCAAAQDAGHACGHARAAEAPMMMFRICVAEQNSLRL